MQCNLKNREQIIEDYLSGRLTEQEKEAFDEHCFNCDICYKELRLREEIIETIKNEGAKIFSGQIAAQRVQRINDKKSFLHKIFSSHPRRLSFAFIGLVLIVAVSGLVLNQWRQRSSRQSNRLKPMIAEKQPLVPQKKAKEQKPVEQTYPKKKEPAGETELLAANFEPSPVYEELLSSNMRSAGVKILAPNSGQNVQSGNIRFQWEGSEEGPFIIKILNNRGQEVASIKTESRNTTVTRNLQPGLYYWKLETAEELLFIGKFVVPARDKP